MLFPAGLFARTSDGESCFLRRARVLTACRNPAGGVERDGMKTDKMSDKMSDKMGNGCL